MSNTKKPTGTIVDGILIPPGFPEVYVNYPVHTCGAGNMCLAGFITGIPETYESDGKLVISTLFPSPGMVGAICAMLQYHSPSAPNDKPKETWHKISECRKLGHSKRMGTSSLVTNLH